MDVWAAGCTAFELATGRFLFQPKVAAAFLFKIVWIILLVFVHVDLVQL